MSSPTLIIGDGNWAVKSGSLLGYEYGELSGQFAPIPITGSRASIATYTNQSGLIVSASSDVLRVDYSTGTGSLLVEPQRTNVALQSQDFDNATWSKGNGSVTANSTTSPDGSSDADIFAGNGILGLHGITRTVTVTINTVYTVSVYAKRNTNDFIQIAAAAGLFGSTIYANYDLNNGVVGNTGGSVTASIQNVGDGWYRCIMTATSLGSVTSSTFGYYLMSSATSSRAENNTLSTSVYLFGSQFEAGAYPSTYIPTTSTSVTRIVDSFSRPNIYTDGVITSGGGTWLFELKNNIAYTRDTVMYLGVGDTSTLGTNALFIMPGVTSLSVLRKRVAGVESVVYITTTSPTKVAVTWNGSTADVFANGTKVVSGSAFTTTNMEYFAGNISAVPMFIPQMKLYNQPLSDAECISLTTL